MEEDKLDFLFFADTYINIQHIKAISCSGTTCSSKALSYSAPLDPSSVTVEVVLSENCRYREKYRDFTYAMRDVNRIMDKIAGKIYIVDDKE